MPGKQVKNWKQYEALRREGKSKESENEFFGTLLETGRETILRLR